LSSQLVSANRRDQRHSGVVDHDVHFSVFCRHRIRERVDRAAVADVEAVRHCLAATLAASLSGFRHGRRIDIGQCDFHSPAD